jgi:hypothetical protein
MIVTAKGHWEGNPTEYCEELRLSAEGQHEAALLAAIFRYLNTPHRLARLEHLVDAASAIADAETLTSL